MLWFKQAAVAVLLLCMLLAFSACGFKPMYSEPATNNAGAAFLQSISIDNIPDRNGQYLRNALIDRLHLQGASPNTIYDLRITHLDKTITNIGIRRDATSTRGQMEIRAKMALVDRVSGKVLLQRDLHTIGAFNQLDNQFATLISEESLTDHMLEELSDNIVNELGLYFSRAAGTTP